MSGKIVVTRLPDAPRVALTYPSGTRTEHADAIEAFRAIFAWCVVLGFRVIGMSPTPDGAIVDYETV